MFSLLTFFLGLIFNLSKSKKQLLAQISLQQKEFEILKRHHRKKRAGFFYCHDSQIYPRLPKF